MGVPFLTVVVEEMHEVELICVQLRIPALEKLGGLGQFYEGFCEKVCSDEVFDQNLNPF